MANDSSSELSDVDSLSSLSQAPSSDESDIQLRTDKGILKFFHKVPKGKEVAADAKGGKGAKGAKSGQSTASPRTAKNAKSATKAAAAKPAGKAQTKITIKRKGKIVAKRETDGGDGSGDEGDEPASPSVTRRERAPSPPHEYVLADNPDIAFIVMFRNRLADAFPRNLTPFGPQELESDVSDSIPGERVEYFLCALLKLLLNRQQDVKPGHYHRALEEAVQQHKNQWVTSWTESPLADGKTFTTMTPTERLTLLRALVLWAMSSSKIVHDLIDSVYKGKRKDDDSNIHLSVQPWGADSDRRRYYLIEGRDDTAFRIYRESNPAGFVNRTWWSVAGSIEETKALIERLETVDGGPKARKLAKRLAEEIPRFEAGEEKRRRREYRQMRRDQFKRPEPGFSVYEGRTRGKRIKYTYSDDEDFLTDSTGPRRSTRQTTGTHTPAEPVTTASGRQIRAPTRMNGASATAASLAVDSNQEDGETEAELGPTGRPRRSAAINHGTNGWAGKGRRQEEAYDEYDSQAEDEDEDASEPELGDDEDEHVPEEDENEDEDDEDESEDVMQLDTEDEDLALGGGAGSAGDGPQGGRASRHVVTMPVHAVLDTETGKWSKVKEHNGAAAEHGAEGATGANADGDVSMADPAPGPQSSEAAAVPQEAAAAEATGGESATASSPTTGGVLQPALLTPAEAQKNGSDGGETAKAMQMEKTASVRLSTPEKENSEPAGAATAAAAVATEKDEPQPLAYRGSPEKTQGSWPMDVGAGN